MTQNTSQIKEKIFFILKTRGPSLPVHIAGGTGLSMLFASAFLSELLSEKKIKISNMRVGSSPIYFIPGQESLLERFSQHLKSKEKEAFILLKQKKFLKNKEQDPAIRVALKEIKDFAIPFKKNEEIFWRYFTVSENEFKLEEKPKQEIKKEPLIENQTPFPSKSLLQQKTSDSVPINKKISEPISRENRLNIFDKTIEKKPKAKKKPKKKTSKINERFFNKVKESLNKKGVEISNIEGFSKKDFMLRVKDNGKEKLIAAYNKKRITESDLIKAYKKASELNLQYIVLSLGEPAKKLSNFIKAIRNLEEINKIN